MPSKNNWHTAPDMVLPGEALALGRLFTDAKRPTQSWRYGRIHVHEKDVHQTNCPYHVSKGAAHGQSVSVSASSLMSFVGVMNAKAKTEAKGEVRTNKVQVTDIDNLEIMTFEPTGEHEDEVYELVDKSKGRYKQKKMKPPSRMYMITGIQTAYGGATSNSKSAEWDNSTRVEAKPAGIKVVKGDVGQSNSGKTHTESQMGRHDFVYAYKYDVVYGKR